jgi:mannose/fructose/N-acetylgalactosamine-specific phosphotransferase system component IIB
VGDIDLKMISTVENSNKFPKTRFWKEKLVKDVVIVGETMHAIEVIMVNTMHQRKEKTLKKKVCLKLKDTSFVD